MPIMTSTYATTVNIDLGPPGFIAFFGATVPFSLPGPVCVHQ